MTEPEAGAVSTRAPAGAGGVAGLLRRLRALGPGDAQRALGWVLVAGWAAWVVLALLALPRPVSTDRLEQDLAEGRVTSWHAVLVDREPDSPVWVDRRMPFPVAVDTVDTDATGGESLGVAYLVDGAVGRLRIVEPVDGATTGAVLVQRMRDSGVPLVHPVWTESDTVVPADLESRSAVVLGLAGLLLVVGGPRPTRGTRWFWFWLLGLPVGVGVLAYAVSEVLRPLPPRVPWAVPQGRMSGLRGLVLWLVGGILLAFVLQLLGDWFGPAWTLPR